METNCFNKLNKQVLRTISIRPANNQQTPLELVMTMDQSCITQPMLSQLMDSPQLLHW
jgi:hypothetical protein